MPEYNYNVSISKVASLTYIRIIQSQLHGAATDCTAEELELARYLDWVRKKECLKCSLGMLFKYANDTSSSSSMVSQLVHILNSQLLSHRG